MLLLKLYRSYKVNMMGEITFDLGYSCSDTGFITIMLPGLCYDNTALQLSLPLVIQ